MMVLTTGNGVSMFTLDRDFGEFLLTRENVSIPEVTREFAINASNRRFWDEPIQRYIEECLAGEDGPRGKNFNMRWVASMSTASSPAAASSCTPATNASAPRARPESSG